MSNVCYRATIGDVTLDSRLGGDVDSLYVDDKKGMDSLDGVYFWWMNGCDEGKRSYSMSSSSSRWIS